MASTYIGLIDEGSIVSSDDGNGLFYVQEKEKSIQDGEIQVNRLVCLPVLQLEENELDAPGIVSLAATEVKDRDNSLTGYIGISLNSGARYLKPDEHGLVNVHGMTRPDIHKKVDMLFNSMDMRYSDLTEAGRYASMNWDKIADPNVKGELSLDGDERWAHTVDRPKKPRKKKAVSLSRRPDLYLEDAVELELISKELYRSLQLYREDVVTLRDAWLFAQQRGQNLSSEEYTIDKFDTAFPAAFFVGSGEGFEPNEKMNPHPVIQYVRDKSITLEDAVNDDLISLETAQTLFFQGDVDDDEPDERQILFLEEAFYLVAQNPDYLSEYDRLNNSNLQLTRSQQEKIITDIKISFAKLEQRRLLETAGNELNAAIEKFKPVMMEQLNAGKAIMKHDPQQEVVARIEHEILEERERIKAGRPPQLSV